MAELKEQAYVFGRNDSLIGIRTEPATGPSRRTAIVIPNAGIIHRVGPSRFVVELARFLARDGYRVFRFDLSGIGDSPASTEPVGRDEIATRDLLDAIDHTLADARADRVVLLGLCSGADDSLVAAPRHDRVAGLVLIDPGINPTRGYYRRRMLSRLRSPRSWWNIISGRSLWLRVRERIAPEASPPPPPELYRESPSIEEQRKCIRTLVGRGAYFLYIVTGGAAEWCNHPVQVLETHPDVFDMERLRLEWRPDADHLFSAAAQRTWLQSLVHGWLETVEMTPDGSAPTLVATAGAAIP